MTREKSLVRVCLPACFGEIDSLSISQRGLWSRLTERYKTVPRSEFSCISWPLISTWDTRQPVWLLCFLIRVSVCIHSYKPGMSKRVPRPVCLCIQLYRFAFASAKQTCRDLTVCFSCPPAETSHTLLLPGRGLVTEHQTCLRLFTSIPVENRNHGRRY